MKSPAVLIVCNALDDSTRIHRGISTDSPAASRKVFMLCQALRLAGVRPYVLSLGRGRANGSLEFHSRAVRRVDGVPVVYAPFSHIPIVSELISLLALLGTVLRVARHQKKAVVFYNRLTLYVPTLIVAASAGYQNILDLEDGETMPTGHHVLGKLIHRCVPWLFDKLCGGGGLLSCSALERVTKVRPVQCYYGTAIGNESTARWSTRHVTFLMAGTLIPETGASTLIEAIQLLRREAPVWSQQVRFVVTGKGSSLDAFKELARVPAVPEVLVHGRTADAQYREILSQCEVGLALKPIGGPLADSTFPSKVIEFAAAGALVLSTDISDVRRVLGAGAVYLTSNDPRDLLLLFKRVVEDPDTAMACAETGRHTVLARCSPQLAGSAVAHFIFERSA